MPDPEIADLLSDPGYYLFGFDGGEALFLRMNRDCYAQSIFFDDRIVTLEDRLIRVPLAGLSAAVSEENAPAPDIGWIFHMAHGGSTLLARALDRVGETLVVREPVTLRALGVAAEAGVAGDWGQRLELAVRMLGRRFADGEQVVVKANVPVNAMIADVLARTARPRGILLHFGLDDYLTAILRSPGHRGWVERIYAEMRIAAMPEASGPAAMQTAEKAAALWLFQMRAFTATLAAHPDLRSLDANILFDDPATSVAAASDYFGRPLSGAVVGAIVAGPLFASYSKNPGAAFDNRMRKIRIAETRAALGDELILARRWIAPRVAERPLPERLGQPLCGENSPLL